MTEVDTEYGPVVVCDECEEGCGINGYGKWHDNVGDCAHVCPTCYEQFRDKSHTEEKAEKLTKD